jgi:peptidoglycan-associated lipoprotein
MKMDRKWIVLAALLSLALMVGCTPKPPPEPPKPPPQEPVDKTPDQDLSAQAKPAEPVADTEKQLPKSLQELQEEYNRSGLLGDIFFDFDRSELRSDARERLAQNAEFMKNAGSDLTFTVEGHCDERGTNEYNIALGESRGSTSVDYLVSLGVGRDRFKTISYGEERPFCTESTEACWQKNRRARFVISGRR